MWSVGVGLVLYGHIRRQWDPEGAGEYGKQRSDHRMILVRAAYSTVKVANVVSEHEDTGHHKHHEQVWQDLRCKFDVVWPMH